MDGYSNEGEEEDSEEEVSSEAEDGTSRESSTSSAAILRTRKHQRRAFRLWKIAADRWDDVTGILRVAECYATGQGCGVDQEKSIEFLERAGDKGDRGAIRELAKYYFEEANVLYKLPRVKSGSAKPSSSDQNEDDPEPVQEKMLRYSRLAASDGDVYSLRHLAQSYQHGTDGVQKDVPSALRLYLEAAIQGDAAARAAAGDILYHGDVGVPRDRVRAFTLFAQCAKEGWAPSFHALAECYRTGYGSPDEKPNETLAHLYYSEAVQQGCMTSATKLGNMIWSGEGCTKDRARAVELYEMAADRGQPEAAWALARCMWFGDGMPADRARAKEIFREALAKGDQFEARDLQRLDAMGDGAFQELLEGA
ncbi:hypothetical protein HKX48_005063 [Thoreauomyces humboldtii]|nr:hypothetical protein HKX48_005063 [Thoreauomyces humboldtii]